MATLFESRDFVRLWLAALLSNFGSMVRGVALPWLAVLVLAAEPRHMAWLGAAGLLPGFALGLFAAAWVDRVRRRPILVGADLGRALLLAAVTGAAFAGWLRLPHLYVAAFALGSLNFLFDVAHTAYLPALVAPDQLLAANSRLQAAEAATEGAAFASAGWLVQWLGAPLALLVDGVSFVASALLIRGIRTREAHVGRPSARATAYAAATPQRPAQRAAGERSRSLALGEGLRMLASSPWLRPLTAAAVLRAFASQLVGVAYMLYVTRELGFEPGPLGLVFAVGALSSFGGAFVAERAGGRIGPGPAMAGGLALGGAAVALLPLAPAGSAAGLALLVAHQLGDGADVVYDVNQKSVRQALVPGHLLGRVSGGIRFAELGAALLGTAVGGFLGETLGLRAALVGAAGTLALAALVVVTSRAGRMRELRAHELRTV